MSKSFHGPFRIKRAEVKFGRDGDCYVKFDDGGNTVIGAIFAPDDLVEIVQTLEVAASRICETPPAHSLSHPALEQGLK